MAGPDPELGRWDPLSPQAAAALFAECAAPWWIAGGYAVAAFSGSFERRPHDDLDVGLLARDQDVARELLRGWDLHCADPPGRLRPWRPGEVLEEPIHDIWARERRAGPWRFQLVLNPAEGGEWVYRRDPRIRRPVVDLVWQSGGIPYLVPEVQLLFKSKTLRPKDEQDLRRCLPLLDERRRGWLRRALEVSHPGHPWLGLL